MNMIAGANIIDPTWNTTQVINKLNDRKQRLNVSAKTGIRSLQRQGVTAD